MFIRRGEKNNTLAGFKERALSVTKGYSVSSLEPLMQTVYESEIKPRLWPKTVAAVKDTSCSRPRSLANHGRTGRTCRTNSQRFGCHRSGLEPWLEDTMEF